MESSLAEDNRLEQECWNIVGWKLAGRSQNLTLTFQWHKVVCVAKQLSEGLFGPHNMGDKKKTFRYFK